MLKKKYRLKKQKDFKKVIESKPFFGEFLTLKKQKNSKSRSRFGFIVSKKVSKKAVERNKIKRRLRGIIKNQLGEIKEGFDVVLFAQKSIISASYKKLENEIIQLTKEADLRK